MKQAYWLETKEVTHYPPLQKDITVDTLVVGGGMCGLLSCYYLNQTNRNIALVEAEHIGQGASGRSTGKLSAQQGYLYHDLIRIHGEDVAKAYYQANIDAIFSIEAIIHDLEISCAYQQSDSLLLALDEKEASYLQKEQEAYDMLHIPYEVLEATPYDIPFIKGLRMMKQASFHPYQFMQGLAKSLSKKCNIYEKTAIRHIEKIEGGYLAHTDRHVIHANSIILATHFPITDLGNFYFTKVSYVQGTLLCAHPSHSFHDAMMISMDSNRVFSLRTYTDHEKQLVMVSGNEHPAGFQNKEDFEEWVTLRKNQLQLKEPIITWQNQDYIAHDRLPLIGNLVKGESGIQFATGFGKWGNTMSVVAAKTMVANLLIEETPYASLFDPHRKQFFFQSDYFSGNFSIVKHYIFSHLKTFFTKDKAPNVYTFHENGTVYGAIQKDGETHIVNIRCPHMGCILNYNEVEETWDCPCHGSRFRYDGELIKGPAGYKLHTLEEEPNSIDPHILK